MVSGALAGVILVIVVGVVAVSSVCVLTLVERPCDVAAVVVIVAVIRYDIVALAITAAGDAYEGERALCQVRPAERRGSACRATGQKQHACENGHHFHHRRRQVSRKASSTARLSTRPCGQSRQQHLLSAVDNVRFGLHAPAGPERGVEAEVRSQFGRMLREAPQATLEVARTVLHLLDAGRQYLA